MSEPYCLPDDIADAVRMDIVLQWAKDDSRENDALAHARINQAILRATEEINLYIGKAVVLPLPSVPAALRDCCVKIAVYKVASRRGILKDSADQTVRQNYEDALSVLQMIANGKVSLGIDQNSAPVKSTQEKIASSFPRNRMISMS